MMTTLQQQQPIGNSHERCIQDSQPKRNEAHLQEERALRLWREYRLQPSEELRNSLIEFYLPFVRHLARRLHRTLPIKSLLGVDDLVSCGVLGVIRSMDRYDPGKGVRFESFSHLAVMGSMIDELRLLDWVPRSVRFQERHGLCAATEMQSLEQLLGEQVGSGSMVQEEALIDSRHQQSVERLTNQELLEALLENVRPREKAVLQLYYQDGLTMREIGVRLGISTGYVNLIRNRALEKTRRRYRMLVGPN